MGIIVSPSTSALIWWCVAITLVNWSVVSITFLITGSRSAP